MENENPPHTLGDYSRPSHEGYQNTIERSDGNNVVPLRSDTIRLVQNGCLFHGIRSEDPNQHLKDFLKIVDSLDLNNDPRDFAKLVKAISLPRDVPNVSDHHLIELENQVQRLMEAHLAHKPSVQVNKLASSCEISSGPHDTRYCMENPELGDSKPFNTLADLGIVKNIEVHIGKLKLLEYFYVIDMEKDPMTPLLAGRGFLATASDEDVPYWTTLGKRESYKPGPSTDKESKELVEKRIDSNRPPKEGDSVWHIKIKLIDPDGPTTRKLSKKENPSEIIDLDHFHDS
ncbi:hypothetical protein Tco_0838590 [Tanacetum coccineum]|uniref:MAK10-like protein n=1 Tax=Tanacetum coccineum TaxID=301880 RepID=A0ABQ5ASF9_9ASTR